MSGTSPKDNIRPADRASGCNDPHHRKQEAIMKRAILVAFTGVVLITGAIPATAQVAGSTTLGVTVTELRDVMDGWSAKRQILGQSVYNEKQERIGTVEDIIISPDKTVSYGIVGAGGFLGFDRRDVAIPVKQFNLTDGRLVLPGATKEALREMPPFEYAPRSEGRGPR
jgi:hypothetical protein